MNACWRAIVSPRGGDKFSREDEEVLLLFASQAAPLIANARTFRAEPRARQPRGLIESSHVDLGQRPGTYETERHDARCVPHSVIERFGGFGGTS